VSASKALITDCTVSDTSKMYDDILLPVDGATEASGVLHHASEIAHWMDATVQLLYVADTARDSVTVVDAEVVDALEREGRDVVEAAGETLDTLGVTYGTDVVQGDPAATIVEYADEYGYDLVAMPTHGRQGLSRYLLGSVTEKVVRLSSVPVLTARVDDEALTFPYERILLPTDGSAGAARAAEHALSLADAVDATLHVLSVVEDAGLGPDVRSTLSGREREAAATTAVDDVVADADQRGVESVAHVEHGSPDDEIRACIDANDLHAVVMGTTGRRGVDRILLGSVAEKTVRTAPVPVVTVRGE
jgi:nucleotide-binding universal stress UspA family protein